MLQTDRKTTEATRREASKDKAEARRKQSSELRSAAALALEAILAGGSWDQLPAEGVLDLSHRIGNAALLDLAALRDLGPETGTRTLPEGPCAAAPTAGFAGGAPLTAEAPDFGAMSPMGNAAPLAM